MHIFQTDGHVRLLKFLSDGSHLLIASGEPNQSLKIWDIRTNRSVELISSEAGWFGHPERVSLSPSNRIYAVYQRRLYAFDNELGQRVTEVPKLECDSVSASPTEVLMLTCRTTDGWIVRACKAKTDLWSKQQMQIHGPILFPNDTECIMYGFQANGGRLHTCNAKTGQELANEHCEHWSVHAKLTPSQESCVTGGYRRFYRYQIGDWTNVDSYRPQKSTTGIREFAFIDETRIVYLDSSATQVKAYDFQTEKLVHKWNWKIGTLTCLDACPRSGLAAAGSKDGRVIVWDLA